MLVVYRTNEPFQGEIVNLDMVTSALALAVYLAQQDAPEIAALVVAEQDLADDTLGALVASVGGYGKSGRFYVAEVNGVMSLVDGGA